MPLIKFQGLPASPDDREPAVAALIAELRSPDAQARRSAAHLLGNHPEAAEALCAAVVVELDESVRESGFTALMRIGTKSAAAGLIPLLQSEDVYLRNGAVEALKSMPEPAADCLVDIFADSTDVRIFGIEILGTLGLADVAHRLIRVVEEDLDVNVCAAAVDGLAACGDREAVAPLRGLLTRFPDEPFLDFAVRRAIARIADADESAGSLETAGS